MHHTADLDWITLSPGIAFKPITFFAGLTGYQLLLRVEPGTVVPLHRHTGEVHAFVLSGQRRILGEPDMIGPGTYVHEPAGNVDSWQAVGDEPCVIHIEVNGRIEYLDDAGRVLRHTDATTALACYVDWCASAGTAVQPNLVGA